MLDYLKRLIVPPQEEEFEQKRNVTSEKSRPNKIHVATSALLIEIAKADGDFSDEERKRIIVLMKDEFDLDDECVNELLELSEQKVRDSISVYEFSSVINENFTQQEKLDLLKNLWRVVYEDGKLDSHEDRLIKIIGSTLNLDHKDVIGAKLFVKEELGK